MGVLQECNGTFSTALLENRTFYLISRDHNQPIKRPEFNEVLYKKDYVGLRKRQDYAVLILRTSYHF